MIQRVVKQTPLFESLGLFTEAPKKNKNAEVITVRPIKKDYGDFMNTEEIDLDDDPDDLSDYNSYLDDDGDVEPGYDPEDSETYEPDDDLLNQDTNEESSGNEQQAPQESPPQEPQTIDATGDPGADPESEEDLGRDIDNTQQGEVSQDDTNNNTDKSNTVDSSEDTSGGNEVIDATGDPGTDPESEGDLGGDLNLDSPSETDSGTDTPADSSGNQEYTKDDMRKFELFNRTFDLYNAVLYIIEKIGTTATDNQKFAIVLKEVLERLKSIESLMKDYMILKFQSDSYLQNSFFYEKTKACIMLILELMEINKKTED